MANLKGKEPELLAGADPEQDCQQPAPGAAMADVPPNEAEDEEAPHHLTWLTVRPMGPDQSAAIDRWRPRRAGWSLWLERIALLVERGVNRLTGMQLNPLYHTGTIAFLLLLVIGVTGVYLFLFFQYGYDASYNAVARMESQFIARTIRAIHRYASGAAVLVTLLHAYRTLFLEKFRGPRWLAWLTGVALTIVIWFAGITGYWLIWDQRAQLITDTFRSALDSLTAWTPRFMVFLTTAPERGATWILFLAILAAHIILFLVAIGFFYLHIRRLKRPRWLPPVHWLVAVAVVLLLGALLFPVGMLPQADLSLLPGASRFDPIFLFFLPFAGARWLWLGLLAVAVGVAALPWLSAAWGQLRRHPSPGPASPALPKVTIVKERCTGCTKCALDCPYGAIEMVERHDGRPHKYIALENLDRCVSCGICVGSCDALAVTLGDTPPEAMWQLVSARMGVPAVAGAQERLAGAKPLTADPLTQDVRGARVVFTCERHAAHSAEPYINGSASPPGDERTVIIPLPCVGAAPPDLLSRTLDAGAIGVKLVGCPPDDCANREGNLWESLRLSRERVPRLRRAYAGVPITAAWLPPDGFATAFTQDVPLDETGGPDYAATRRWPTDLSWRNLVPAFLLLAAALLVQILLTELPFRAYPDRPALVQFVAADLGAVFDGLAAGQVADPAYRLELVVDGDVVRTETWTAADLLGEGVADTAAYFAELTVPPGEHHVLLRLVGTETGARHVLLDGTVSVEAGAITRPSLDVQAERDCPVWPVNVRPRPCPQ